MRHLGAASTTLSAAATTHDVQERLTLLARAREEVDLAIMDAVGEVGGAAASCAKIGACLGVTRQAARARFGRAISQADVGSADVPTRPSGERRPRTELVSIATAGGWTLLRLRILRVPLSASRRSR